MTSSRSGATFVIVFAVVYVIAVENNYALFTYHPGLGELGPLAEPPRDGPAMYWYGWMAMAGMVALIGSAIAYFVPERLASRLWSGLVVGCSSDRYGGFQLSLERIFYALIRLREITNTAINCANK